MPWPVDIVVIDFFNHFMFDSIAWLRSKFHFFLGFGIFGLFSL
jgi:hypothetical protein